MPGRLRFQTLARYDLAMSKPRNQFGLVWLFVFTAIAGLACVSLAKIVQERSRTIKVLRKGEPGWQPGYYGRGKSAEVTEAAHSSSKK